jgi:hypothetical protein
VLERADDESPTADRHAPLPMTALPSSGAHSLTQLGALECSHEKFKILTSDCSSNAQLPPRLDRKLVARERLSAATIADRTDGR